MKMWIRLAMLVTLTVCGTIAPSAQEPKAAPGAPAADDNMFSIRGHVVVSRRRQHQVLRRLTTT